MPLAANTKLGAYEIVAPLGAGGMGEVYRARDTRLDREVALKVLPEAFARDPQRLGRFEREAKVVASLNHPNIAALYGFEDSTGVAALVMELVEGVTLADRIAMGPVGVEEALPILRQVAEGLEYAHERGIVHRDLKPANIKIAPNGAVKILDFGLAKAFDTNTASQDPLTSPTLSGMASQAGIILGTAPYMSPEQAKGKPVDRRTDIWAFGCVLYEILTARRAFEGETVTDVLAAVVRADPDWSALPKSVPPRIRELLRRCLEKDSKRRLRDIGEARITIEEASAGAPNAANSPLAEKEQEATQGRSKALLLIAAFLVGALLTGTAVWLAVHRSAPVRAMHFSAVTNFAGVQAQPAFSPDGRSVAFVSNRDGHYNIYVSLVRGGNLVQVTKDANLKSRPAWSPDGSTLAYARLNDSGVWDVWEIPALGGSPRRLILGGTGPAWSPDGHSLAYENIADSSLWVAGADGENAHQVAPAELNWRDTEPRFSPDGTQIAFSFRSNGPYGEIEVLDLRSGGIRALTNDAALASSPAWSPDGRSIYFASSRGGTVNIWKVPTTGGTPEQITAGQGDDAQLDVSADGSRIVFSTWHADTKIARIELAATGAKQSITFLTDDAGRNQVAPVYSSDGKCIAYFSNRKGAEAEGIWYANADGSNPVELVGDGNVNVFPLWAPDNQHVFFLTYRSTADEYRSVSLAGGAAETLLKLAKPSDRLFDVGKDGRILYRASNGSIETFDPQTRKSQVLGNLPGNLKWAPVRLSPDERSVAYVVAATRADDPKAGLWVSDFKNPARQLFHGWVDWWFTLGPKNEIYFLAGKADLSGSICKVQWDGQGLNCASATLPMNYSYWADPGENAQDRFAVSPDGRYVAFGAQTVLGANIGMIENLR